MIKKFTNTARSLISGDLVEDTNILDGRSLVVETSKPAGNDNNWIVVFMCGSLYLFSSR